MDLHNVPGRVGRRVFVPVVMNSLLQTRIASSAVAPAEPWSDKLSLRPGIINLEATR